MNHVSVFNWKRLGIQQDSYQVLTKKLPQVFIKFKKLPQVFMKFRLVMDTVVCLTQSSSPILTFSMSKTGFFILTVNITSAMWLTYIVLVAILIDILTISGMSAHFQALTIRVTYLTIFAIRILFAFCHTLAFISVTIL